ncbi:MAG: hypothetical protein Q7U74_15345, partial [Saprospiraceae bacterium]|nr:hypothetical protein [Saprospiraceae bacterium]
LLAILCACSPAVSISITATVPSIPTIQLSQTPSPTWTPVPTATRPAPTVQVTPTDSPQIKLPLYTLKATFDYNRHYLAVEQLIDYTNHTGQLLSNLLLVVEPNNHPGTFKLKSLKIGDVAVTTFVLDKNQLTFNLPEALPNGQSIRLAAAYELSLPVIPAPSNEVRAAIFGYSARQANLVDWYPYIPPYQKEKGWLVHHPWFYGEHQVYGKADFRVEITLIDPPANFTIAAAGQATVEGALSTYIHRNARNFTFSASNMYSVYATTVGSTSITSYVFPFDAPGGRTALNDAAKALEVYNRLFGPYPHPSLAVVEADFHDGMEFDGLYFLSKAFYSTYDGTPKGYLTLIGVHETAH